MYLFGDKFGIFKSKKKLRIDIGSVFESIFLASIQVWVSQKVLVHVYG